MTQNIHNENKQQSTYTGLASLMLALIGFGSVFVSVQMIAVSNPDIVSGAFAIAAAISFGFLNIASVRS